MMSVFEELGIPKKHFKETSKQNRYIAVVHKTWLKSLVKHLKAIKFIENSGEIWPFTEEYIMGSSWMKIFVTILNKQDSKVIPLPKVHSVKNGKPFLFPQLMQYIAHTNLVGLWKEAYKKYMASKQSKEMLLNLIDYNKALIEVISRVYGCPIINICDPTASIESSEQFEMHLNVMPVTCAVETPSAIFLLHVPHLEYNLNNCLTFSPAILENSYTKSLFIIYQLLNILKDLHERSLTLGEIGLNDIFIKEDLWIYVFPQIESNLHVKEDINPRKSISINQECQRVGHVMNHNLECEYCGSQTYDKVPVDKQTLEELCHLWIFGQISNFSYVSALNEMSGRVMGDPNCHYVFPWVTDFTSRCGKNWRDLKKSKYRLNKGDHQLDLTYNNSQSQVPHHVSDVLSPITYYVYMARRTPVSVLCKNVRTVWVPAEYPGSIHRIQEWTPDECIPEFYTDPNIFRSIHDDMEDLVVPSWASGPEDFVEKHRKALESPTVSEKLHHWIDLTFGYKLSGVASIKSRNVCLNLVDAHENLTKSGLVQLFAHPHPPKNVPSPYWSKIPPKIFPAKRGKAEEAATHATPESPRPRRGRRSSAETERGEGDCATRRSRSYVEEETGRNEGQGSPSNPNVETIHLPKDYRPEHALEVLEKRHAFFSKTFAAARLRSGGADDGPDEFDGERGGGTTRGKASASRAPVRRSEDRIVCHYADIISKRRMEELKVLGCLVVEIFMAKQLKSLGSSSRHLSLDDRLENCLSVMRHSDMGLPPCISYIVDLLLRPEYKGKNSPPVTDIGLPPPSPRLLLEPLLHCAPPFSEHLPPLYALLSDLKRFEHLAVELHVLDHEELLLRLAECKVTTCVEQLDRLLHLVDPGTVAVALPHVQHLLEDPPSAVLAAWHLFEPVARALGPREAARRLLPPLLRLYDSEHDEPRRPYLGKLARLYHHSYLLGLMARLGLQRFLDKFVAALVEAVGGRKDLVHSELEEERPRISETSSDSLVWLSHRLGPLLTARYLSRNLLKMLALCYVGAGSLSRAGGQEAGGVSIADGRVVGDEAAARVLECLSSISGLYGEQIILFQYIPYMTEMIQLCKKRLTPNLEGGLISCLALLKYIIPYFTDVMLMDQLQDVILTNIVHPIVRLLNSVEHAFPSGRLARSALARKYLDVIYVLSIRIGTDMTKKYLVVPALQRFFLIFDKVNDVDKISLAQPNINSNETGRQDDKTTPESPTENSPEPDSENQSPEEGRATDETSNELRDVFTPELARAAYWPFAKLVGSGFLEISLKNHDNVRNMCREGGDAIGGGGESKPIDCPTGKTVASSGSIGSNIAMIGNRIDVQPEVMDDVDADLLSLVRNRVESNTRHLRGNWLAYWESEIGRSEKNRALNFKQIKLQTFVGHTQSVKCIYALDNENSFLSGSRDKTVKLWSLRSQGDGSTASNCQWTYSAHKKSILSIGFVESLRLVASCDSVVHIWDPFMGVNLGSLESAKNAPVNVLRSMPAPSTLVFAATTEGTIKIIDTKMLDYVQEIKISLNPSGLVRCLAVARSGLWLAAGQSSGNITVLDTRTGLIVSNWRAHDSEVLQLAVHDDDTLISSGLDQNVCVWNVRDGKFNFQMRGTTEPVHCLSVNDDELISGTTANRIGVHSAIAPDAVFSNNKLRSDTFKGLLTSMDYLPLNRLLLLGADTGTISLLC